MSTRLGALSSSTRQTGTDGVPVAYEKFAPGLKSLADAVGIRNRMLTFVLVGAGLKPKIMSQDL